MGDVQSGLQHLLLLQKNLKRSQREFSVWIPERELMHHHLRHHTHGVGHVVGDSFAKHRGGQSGVDVFGVQVVVLAVEEQRGGFAAQQVGERAPDHGETEHGSILWVENKQRHY